MDNCTGHIAVMIKMISEEIERLMDVELKEYNITNGQLRLLLVVGQTFNGECRLKQLEKIFSFSSAAITGTVNRLESKGFIQSFVAMDDKRTKCIKLTESGRGIIDTAFIKLEDMEKKLVEGFTKEQQDMLKKMLGAMYSNI